MRSLFLAVAISLFALSSLSAQTDESKLIVTGEAILYDIPENVGLQIPISAKDVSYQACSDQLMSSYNALSKALVKKGIDPKAIRAGRVSISENFTYADGSRKQDGYLGNINVSLELLHTEKSLNDIFHTLKDEQFKFGYSLMFLLSEKQKSDLKAAAIQVAIEDAKKKAEVIAESLNLQLLAVEEVIFGDRDGGPEILLGRHDYALMKASNEENVDVQLNPEKIEIRKNITIHWRMSK